MLAEPEQGPGGPAPFAVVSTDGDDTIIGKTVIGDGLIGSLGSLAANRLKGSVHLVQREVGRQGTTRPPPCGTPLLPPSLQDLLHEVHHGWGLPAPRDLLPEDLVPDRVAVTV